MSPMHHMTHAKVMWPSIFIASLHTLLFAVWHYHIYNCSCCLLWIPHILDSICIVFMERDRERESYEDSQLTDRGDNIWVKKLAESPADRQWTQEVNRVHTQVRRMAEYPADRWRRWGCGVVWWRCVGCGVWGVGGVGYGVWGMGWCHGKQGGEAKVHRHKINKKVQQMRSLPKPHFWSGQVTVTPHPAATAEGQVI